MSNIKYIVANFISSKFFYKEVQELKKEYYAEEREKVYKEMQQLKSSFKELQKDYCKLQQLKLTELIETTVAKEDTPPQEISKEKDLFDEDSVKFAMKK